MDAASTTTSRINKFDGTNFHTWKFKMAMVLEERDLWEVTSGEIKLEHCATTLDQTTFKRKSRKALAIICLAMEDSQLPLVRSAKELRLQIEEIRAQQAALEASKYTGRDIDEADEEIAALEERKIALKEQLPRKRFLWIF
ncbi:hypothetical protein ON010_g9928 [Phytophthora cinnamomi]|nr:hypothetical protein ON010_g9928 [Phytophthora cinnamomi]